MSSLSPDDLAKSYLELAQLHQTGATAEARVLYHRIAHALRSSMTEYWTQGLHDLAAGRCDAALLSVTKALGVHRQNLINLELPMSKATCFAQIARIFEAMGQPVASAAANMLAANDGASFYTPSPSCQIHVLAGLYETLFGHRTDGTFVEVGAYDGEMFSNTSCLADRGWRGLYIEPVESSYQQCVARHRANTNVTVVNRAIGPVETMIRFWSNGQFSTGSVDEMIVNAKSGWIGPMGMREIEVRQVRLDTTLRAAGIEPGFDLLVVDVDGMEEAVFDSFDLPLWRPRCMIVELIERMSAFAGHEGLISASSRVRDMIERSGYETAYRDQGNTLFRATP
jgi:FkbM family methyltransferase